MINVAPLSIGIAQLIIAYWSLNGLSILFLSSSFCFPNSPDGLNMRMKMIAPTSTTDSHRAPKREVLMIIAKPSTKEAEYRT